MSCAWDSSPSSSPRTTSSSSTLALIVTLISFAYSPRGYAVADRSIIVRRMAGQVRIPLDEVRELRRSTDDDLRGCIRLRGSGGLFGYYGLFRSSKLGEFTEYVTNRSNSVVLITGSKTVLFSPDDVDGFLNAIRAIAPVSASASATAPALGSKPGTAQLANNHRHRSRGRRHGPGFGC